MKKAYFYLLFGIFALFVLTGFIGASRFLVPPINQKISETYLPAPVNQTSVLIVQVDDMALSQPRLISAWGVFISHTQPSQVLIKTVYPELTPNPARDELARLFSLDKNGLPNGAFLNKVRQNAFNVQHVLVLDQTSLKPVTEWISGRSVSLAQIAPTSMDAAQNILVQDAAVFNEICRGLALRESSRGPKPDWQLLVGQHFVSDYPLDRFLQDWELLANPSAPPQCEILAEP